MKEIQGLGGKFSRRQFLTLTGGVVTTAVLASCVATEQGGGGAGADTAVTEFSFAWWTGGEGANKLFEESIDHFEEKHPEYSINRISAPYGEFGTKILTMYGSGNAPDAHGVPWGTVWSWANKGVLLDLTPFVEADNTIDWEGMWPAVTGGCRFPADKIIALPRESFGLMLHVYNKALFEEAGVETPDQDMAADNWTWDTWRAKAKDLTKFSDDGRREIMGASAGAGYWDLQVVMPSYGVAMFNDDLSHFNLDDPRVVAWLSMLPQMTNEDRSLGKPDETKEFDWGSSGKQAMVQSATWSIPNMRETWAEIDWDFVPPPKGACCHSNFVGCDYHVINGSDYANWDAGWELLKFLNSPEEDLWWALNFFGAPFRKSNVEAWATQLNDVVPLNGWQYVLDMTENATPWTPIPFQDELNTIHENEIVQAISGERSVEEVVASITSKVDEMIANFS
ncbi:MAG: extracellular solute-binding protein [Caldilineaceae bacterium]|nr:extracellular solute-binding protein [Caldilineaceae bacterium]